MCSLICSNLSTEGLSMSFIAAANSEHVCSHNSKIETQCPLARDPQGCRRFKFVLFADLAIATLLHFEQVLLQLLQEL